MAPKIAVAPEEDLDGSPAEETVRLGVGGAKYEIDLSKTNAKTFRTAVTPFVEQGRRGAVPAAGSAVVGWEAQR